MLDLSVQPGQLHQPLEEKGGDRTLRGQLNPHLYPHHAIKKEDPDENG
jgi:hypothetical protein